MPYTALTFGCMQRAHTYHHFSEMTNMPDEIFLARVMKALDLEI